MFIGVDNKAREVKDIYVGDSNGIARKVSNIYYGVNSTAKMVYTDERKTCSNSFAGLTYQQIKDIALSGEAYNTFAIGDYFTVPLNDYYIYSCDLGTFYQKEVVFEVADNTLFSQSIQYGEDSITKAKLRLVAKFCNVKPILWGVPDTAPGLAYKYSYVKQELNTVFLDLMPSELTDILPSIIDTGGTKGKIVQVTKYDDWKRYPYNKTLQDVWDSIMTQTYENYKWTVLAKDGIDKVMGSYNGFTFTIPVICF